MEIFNIKTWKSKFQKLCAVLLAVYLIAGCMQVSTVEAATSKSGTTYYYTHFNRQKGSVQVYSGKKYYMPSTTKATCKGNTLTMYSSFNTSKNGVLNNQSKKAFVKYGKHTFKLTSNTKYYFSDIDGKHYCTKAHFLSTVKRLRDKLEDGEITETEYYLKEIKFPMNPIDSDKEYTGSLNLDDDDQLLVQNLNGDEKAAETAELLKDLFPDFSYVKRKRKPKKE